MAKIVSNFNSFEVVSTSARGAKLLVADNGKAVWVMGRSVREDGTLTDSAIKALNESEWSKEDALASVKTRDEYKKQKSEFFKEIVNCTIEKKFFKDYNEKCFKVATTDCERVYGHTCHVYTYLPKSVVSKVSEGKDHVILAMPRWMFGNKKICGVVE